ncbi:phospholipase D family protein [Alteribacillus sp. HJP-4]|uniref:phospholipase D family protein n=1 Tax=Alteribacillus sp. HJP-4 TaxID=2775394 RepID=UPI0035CD1A3A
MNSDLITKMTPDKKPILRRPGPYLLAAVLVVLSVSVYHYVKPLPPGISYEGDVHEADGLEFIYDVTYEAENGSALQEQEIFERLFQMIEDAEEFIFLDMFLFNDDYDRSMEFPALSKQLSDILIEKKQQNPEMEIIFLTDPINTFYGTYLPDHLKELEENDIHLFMTNLSELRDSNPLYSGIHRTFLQWFGTSEKGWLPNVFSLDAPDVNIRSYLSMFHFKANHRKTVLTENEGMVTSANPHDASAHHSNIAVTFQGGILEDLLASEKAAAIMSGADKELFDDFAVSPSEKSDRNEENEQVQLLTEKKIKNHVLEEITTAEAGDELKLGMFYLSDRDIIQELLGAAEREVSIKIVLDVNKDAFGSEKNGIPNRPVAGELIEESGGGIDIRWYETDGEQFHSKFFISKRGEEMTFIGGSSNFTKRNLHNFNLETNVRVSGHNSSPFLQETEAYFNRIWNNENGTYTAEYKEYEDNAYLKKWLYRFQEWSGLSTF